MTRRVIITGAGSGIGAATARALAAQGADLWLTYRNSRDETTAVADECQALGAASAKVSMLDLRDPASIDELLASRGVRVVDWAGWLRLDSHERALGEIVGRERVKVVPRDEMLDISLGPVPAPTA